VVPHSSNLGQFLSTFGGLYVYTQRGYPADSYFSSFQGTPYALPWSDIGT